MTSPAFAKLLQPILRIQQIVWGAFTASLAVYGAVGYMIAAASGRQPRAIDPAIEMGIVAAAAIAAVSAVYLWRSSGTQQAIDARLAKTPDVVAMASLNTAHVADPERMAAIRALDEREQRALSVASWASTQQIICWGLNEAVGMMGLILNMLTYERELMLPFLGAAVLLNMLMRPRISSIVDRALGRAPSF